MIHNEDYVSIDYLLFTRNNRKNSNKVRSDPPAQYKMLPTTLNMCSISSCVTSEESLNGVGSCTISLCFVTGTS